MNLARLFDIGAAIVGVAMVTTIVSHPESASVITAAGTAFSNSIDAALGRQ